jgi:hypothetical protein
MGFRGLVWTLPCGHMLQMAGYGWQVPSRLLMCAVSQHNVYLLSLLQFSLSGAFMPVIYTIGVYSGRVWTASSWQPQQCQSPEVFSQDWVSLALPQFPSTC